MNEYNSIYFINKVLKIPIQKYIRRFMKPVKRKTLNHIKFIY